MIGESEHGACPIDRESRRKAMTPSDHLERMERVRVAIEGLSVGDALGEQFFRPARRLLISYRQVPDGPWRYTDDTEMALAIAETLDAQGHVHQDDLAGRFARRYIARPNRGYGAGAARLLTAVDDGESWREVGRSLFGGEGSMGNGAAMRAAPVGAYFADDYGRTATEARKSAEVTHQHPEGIDGAVAVAIASAWAWQRGRAHSSTGMLETVLDHLPSSDLRVGCERALRLRDETSFDRVVGILGNGSKVVSRDTVPFCLWCTERHIDDYPAALWTAFTAGGDIDTNGAIVGGIVALATGMEGIPIEWRLSREPLGI
jgi:ADP-ribosylglycohydrolase